MDEIRWAIVVAAVIHVVEELGSGWLRWAQRHVPGITICQFLIINAAFILLCFFGAFAGSSYPVFSLSISSLIFINALIHIIPAMRFRCYIPGLVSAVFFYVPLAIMDYYLALYSQHMKVSDSVKAGLLGLAWMSVPFLFQVFRLVTDKLRVEKEEDETVM